MTLAMLPFLDRYPPHDAGRKAGSGTIARMPFACTLAAIFLFQCANMALLAYMIRLGMAYGWNRDYVSTALGLATWVALAVVMLIPAAILDRGARG